MLRNRLKRAVSGRTKRHIKLIIEKKKILIKYLYTSPSGTLLVYSRSLIDITLLQKYKSEGREYNYIPLGLNFFIKTNYTTGGRQLRY